MPFILSGLLHNINEDKLASAQQQFLDDFLLGSYIAAAVKSVAAPIERVKLTRSTMEYNPDLIVAKIPITERITNYFGELNSVRLNMGMIWFWRGNLVNCLRYAPQQGCALAFNDALNDMLPYSSANTNFWKSLGAKLLSGGLAGAIAITLTFPFDFARTRLASDAMAGRSQFKGIAHCIFSIAKSQGITGLYIGWPIAVALSFVDRAGQLGFFKQIQDMSPHKNDKGVLGAISSIAAVTVAHTLVMPFIFPFYTVRRRMTFQKPNSVRQYKGPIDCLAQVLQKEGVRGLYKGIVLRGVGGSLVIVIYDRIKTKRGGYG